MHDNDQNQKSISLILPAWNEAEVIATAVAEADAALSQLTVDYEIIVVDDGSTDDTGSIVRKLAMANDHVRLVEHSPNQGYGAAIRSGFASADSDLVVFTDADCQFDLTELDRFVLLSNRYDIVCGYRIDRKDTPLRCLYSKVYNLLVRLTLGTGVRDVDCALKLFHRDVAKRIQIAGNGFLVSSEMLVQARRIGCSVCEVGVSHRPRMLGESTVSVQHIPKVLTSLTRYWWNEIQFPAVVAPRPVDNWVKSVAISADEAEDRKSWRLPMLQIGLLLIAAVFMLTNLSYPLIDRDETRYAEIPREMIATGNWILPQLNFHTYYDKPPLVYWLCAISFKLFGISEASARLVPSLAALATLACTMFFGSRIFGRRVGLFAGVVLFLSVGFAFTSRYLLLDGVLTLFVSLSLFTAYEAIRVNPSSRSVPSGRGKLVLGWWIASSVFIGLALLTKGPIAIALWLPPVFAFAWLSEADAKPRWWHYGLLGAVAAMIAMPWFILAHQQDPTFLCQFFYKHHFARFAGEFHPKPIWFFVPVLLIAGHPWSFLTIPYAKFLVGRGETTRARRPPALGFMLLYSLWCFAFFSISACKLPTYLLPAAPPLALMLGHYLNEILQDSGNPTEFFFARLWSARTATATTCVAGVSFVLFVVVWTGDSNFALFGWATIWAMWLMVSLLPMADRHQAKIAWASSTGAAFLFTVMVMHQMVPAYSRSQTLFGETSPLGDQLAVAKSLPIATIDHEFSEVPFYLERRDIPNFLNVNDTGVADFVSQAGMSILIVDDLIGPNDLADQLPKTAKLTKIGHRGSALIYQATNTASPPQMALVPDGQAQGAQR
ncbi:Undecaprenyl phosphate-alpha-4-amino-4-deoxy-L-arabinose arabinosyl transferase [Novipirellula aureliae]|uniref:Undecaprenyl phosphate-alpha-4-amino-4-deoxy-L-arabinose arabinosyl transferase n=1 Tax=Novipirellula aureliae TaxID=2527966 RepID=A0A5C6DL85_9BACT|nr:glycosyltransferase [Novipirellula aureliae]TWU35669.1 Undecaprenyl phosphate-alpha-4-amino-4-deoxy-L-arabinose arabinosyl transferase [Novipirellula aureliae]